MRLRLSNNTTFEPLREQEQCCTGCDRIRACVVFFDDDGYSVELCSDCLVDLANEVLGITA